MWKTEKSTRASGKNYPIATGKLVNTGSKYIFSFGLSVLKMLVINK
jgi:hypothetical protein